MRIDGNLTISSEVLNLLTGAYAIDFEDSVADPAVRSVYAGFQELLREHVGYQPNTYGDHVDEFNWRFFSNDRALETFGYELRGELLLDESRSDEAGNPLPTARFTLHRTKPKEEVAKVQLPLTPTSREDIVAELDDPEHFVFWNDISLQHVRDYLEALERATDERTIHTHLKSNPMVLVQPFSSGHGRWVYPSRRLGNDHEVDFMVLTKDSSGHVWTMIELEPPNEKPFLKNGQPGKRLREALHQVESWRIWLASNREYARKPKEKSGLGLTDITARTRAIILIGRDTDYGPGSDEWRRSKRDHEGIEVHSYDWLARKAGDRAPSDRRARRR